jgi:hypothetical protein
VVDVPSGLSLTAPQETKKYHSILPSIPRSPNLSVCFRFANEIFVAHPPDFIILKKHTEQSRHDKYFLTRREKCLDWQLTNRGRPHYSSGG